MAGSIFLEEIVFINIGVVTVSTSLVVMVIFFDHDVSRCHAVGVTEM
ncbi:MAG: hypothetical protein ABI691_03525 [Ginsengibacter sp.]